MYNATDKCSGSTRRPPDTGSPAPAEATPRRQAGPPARSPAIANRTPVVPPLKLAGQSEAGSSAEPDSRILSSPPSSPTRSPLKSTSPRKVARCVSEKLSSARTQVAGALSPRMKVADLLQGVQWLDDDTPPSPPRTPDTNLPQGRKRKAEGGEDRGDEKRVRFQLPDDTPPAEKRAERRTNAAAAVTAPGTSTASTRSHARQIDQLVEALGLPYGRPRRPSTPAPDELTPPELLPETAFNRPSIGKRDATSEAGPAHDRPATDRVPTERPGEFPFAPDKLGKWAIKQRHKGMDWVGKATGESFAATLQRTLDKLRAENGDRINHEACRHLQELFGLLPAGITGPGKAFNYLLLKSFYSLGLTNAQWDAIERLHNSFDQLDTRSDPQGFGTLKEQLREIVAARKGLAHLKRQAAAQARKEAES